MEPHWEILNLKAIPFWHFELYEESFDEKTIEIHKTLFKDREEIVDKLFLSLTGGTSYKVVLHGPPGIGKSSILNRVIYDARKSGYFAMKYKITQDSAKDNLLLRRELLRTFGEAITREALQNKNLRDFIISIVRRKIKRDLRHIALLSLLYSAGQLVFKGGRLETYGLLTTLGIPMLSEKVSTSEQSYVEIARTETLSPIVFEDILKKTIALLKEWRYKDVIIAIDDIDKLKEERFERTILDLVKQTFYPAALCHILLLMSYRNDRKEIHSDIFHYEQVDALPRKHVFEFLNELYELKAIDKNIPFKSVVETSILEQLYEKSNGKVRDILEDLHQCVVEAVRLGHAKIDGEIYQKVIVSNPLHSYIRALRPSEGEYKIISYLLKNNITYTRDEGLAKYTALSKSAINSKLKNLLERGVLISRREGKKVVYSIHSSAQPVIKLALQ